MIKKELTIFPKARQSSDYEKGLFHPSSSICSLTYAPFDTNSNTCFSIFFLQKKKNNMKIYKPFKEKCAKIYIEEEEEKKITSCNRHDQ